MNSTSPGNEKSPEWISFPPATAARLAQLLRERGLSADIRAQDRALVLTVRNSAVPFGKLSQQVAVIGNGDSEAFVWLFEGARQGTWDTEPLGPAADVEAAADRFARVLSAGDRHDNAR